MSELKYRINNRLSRHNYSKPGYYFVTICTHNRNELFGMVEENKVILNEYGHIVHDVWTKIPDHFTDVAIDDFCVMPNHIHGVIFVVGDADLRPLRDRSKMLLSKVIHGVKSTITRIIRTKYNNCDTIWQRSYFDSIIKNKKSLNTIREYIKTNPEIWDDDIENINMKH